MAQIIVLYDACVLYPAPLRDLFMHLAIADLYRAKWTDAIHDEWIRNVLADRPDLKKEQLERARRLMNQHVRDCLVENYQKLMPSLQLPDPDDRHVLAAAIRAQASIILTFNIKDFPATTLKRYGIIAQHPDEFLMHLISMAPDTVCSAIKRLRANLKNPPISAWQYLAILKKQTLHKTVKALEPFAQLL
jgi:predicted nucleic acid-binding protein